MNANCRQMNQYRSNHPAPPREAETASFDGTPLGALPLAMG